MKCISRLNLFQQNYIIELYKNEISNITTVGNKRSDVETGLYYCKSRYYNPKWCRWLNADDVSCLDPESINGLNLYAYCKNNPVMCLLWTSNIIKTNALISGFAPVLMENNSKYSNFNSISSYNATDQTLNAFVKNNFDVWSIEGFKITNSGLNLISLSYTGLRMPINLTEEIVLSGEVFKASANIGMDYKKYVGFDFGISIASIGIGTETVGAEVFYGVGISLSLDNHKLKIKFGVGVGASFYIDLGFLFRKPVPLEPAPISIENIY